MHHVKDFVEKHFKRVLLESEQQKIQLTLLKFSKNWSKYHRIRDRFETELSDWLDSELFCGIIFNVSIRVKFWFCNKTKLCYTILGSKYKW